MILTIRRSNIIFSLIALFICEVVLAQDFLEQEDLKSNNLLGKVKSIEELIYFANKCEANSFSGEFIGYENSLFFEIEGNLIERRSYRPRGNKIDIVWKFEYEGKNIKSILQSVPARENKVICKLDYIYGVNGLLSQKKEYRDVNYNIEGLVLNRIVDFEYDNKGSLLFEHHFSINMSSKKLDYKTRIKYLYDRKDRLEKIQQYYINNQYEKIKSSSSEDIEKNGILQYETFFYYNKKNVKIKEVKSSISGSDYLDYIKIFNDEGFLIEESTFNRKSKVISRKAQYTRDGSNKLLKKYEVRKRDFQQDYSEEMIFDENGNLLSYIAPKPYEHSKKIQYFYDEKKNWIKKITVFPDRCFMSERKIEYYE